VGRAWRAARARERALRAAQAAGGVVHRLPPGELHGGALRNRARRWLLSGALVELGPGAGKGRVIDLVAADAGITDLPGGVRLSTAGAAIVFGTSRAGEPAVLRASAAGTPGDPRPGDRALRSIGVRRDVPAPISAGQTAGAAWTLETTLHGVRPRRAPAWLVSQVCRFLAELPRAEGPPSSFERDFPAIASALPDRADPLAGALERARSLARAASSVARHGDMWLGNLLVSGRRLTGVVDWDSYDQRGVPGADLFQLLGADLALRAGRQLGEVWAEAPWRTEAFGGPGRDYWRAVAIEPDADATLLAAIAWWAASVAGTLSRVPERSADERWVALNVDPVLEALARM
jgi:hypothetical protein